MMSCRGLLKVLALIGITGVLFLSVPASGGEIPKKGDSLAAIKLQPPAAEKERVYLGITKHAFRLPDIRSKLLFLEIIGVYCPACYRQAPIFNNLYNRIEKSSLKGKVKMLALAAGGNQMEIQYLNEQKQYSFPIVPDPSFEVHKLLGEPRTPFILLLNPEGKVLYTHMGVIEDLDAFWKTITELIR
ncbi:MAG: TlpA disulfide reductase family protein [Pseudomonadota bacterium]|nr:TlpA family protein disulfide reductase [Pseudomonadota bacterium]MBU1569924.1 TlpA family protein disulfide reductase [Pseudomonadota bacterium]